MIVAVKSDYPYQLVAFIGTEPPLGDPVYSGPHGWYPQIALKRRFKVSGMDEPELIKKIDLYCKTKRAFTIKIGGLTQPHSMPVKVLSVAPTPELMAFHRGYIKYFGDSLYSRYPERDGTNYLPHITAEWEGKMVIDDTAYANKELLITKIYLLKDLDTGDSIAYRAFCLDSAC